MIFSPPNPRSRANSDLRTAKTRPELIVHADNSQTGLSQVIVAMITSRLFRANHSSRVVLEVLTPIGQRTGLLTDSAEHTPGKPAAGRDHLDVARPKESHAPTKDWQSRPKE